MNNLRRYVAAGICVGLLTLGALTLRNRLAPAAFAAPPEPATAPADTFNIAIDSNVHPELNDLGLHKSTITISAPGDHKITFTCLVYRDGKLDPRMSSRIVHLTESDKPYKYIYELGFLDPTATNPTPTNKIRLMAHVYNDWVEVNKKEPSAGNISSFGYSNPLPIGKETKLGYLGIGLVWEEAKGPKGEITRTQKRDAQGDWTAALKVTASVLVEPMTDKDIEKTWDRDHKENVRRFAAEIGLPISDAPAAVP